MFQAFQKKIILLIIDFLFFELIINIFENVQEIKHVFSPKGSIFLWSLFSVMSNFQSVARSVFGLIQCHQMSPADSWWCKLYIFVTNHMHVSSTIILIDFIHILYLPNIVFLWYRVFTSNWNQFHLDLRSILIRINLILFEIRNFFLNTH